MFNIFRLFKKNKKTQHEFDLEKLLLEINFSTEIIYDLKKYFKLDKKAFFEKLHSLIDVEDYKIPKQDLQGSMFHKPYVILMLGVNGVGKTTSSAKLAYMYKNLGYKVKLVAADTFRAGARDQLEKLAKKVGCDYYTNRNTEDAAAVGYKAIEIARQDNTDIVIVDTGGRLHNKQNLMSEIKKLKKVLENLLGRNIDQKILVLDATQGQSTTKQVNSFLEFTDFDGVLLSKFDSFKNFGTIFALGKLKQKIFYLGTGESLKDLKVFKKEDIFVKNEIASK